ncbi:MAG: DUF6174 domain-containing protein [Sandaracinaceae bacterium]|nr:DUF6174 domain-containing protein [Sandaracinaceae bacterium]
MTRRTHGRSAAAVCTLALLAACSGMEPLTGARLDAAEQRWRERGSESYRMVVRVSADRLEPVVHEVLVRGGEVAAVRSGGEPAPPERAADYSVPGLFELAREELHLLERPRRWRDAAGADLFARFDPETGRLERYRRTLGDARRYLLIEVLSYEADDPGG